MPYLVEPEDVMWSGLNHSINIQKVLFQPGSLSTTGWAAHIQSHGMLKYKFSFNNIHLGSNKCCGVGGDKCGGGGKCSGGGKYDGGGICGGDGGKCGGCGICGGGDGKCGGGGGICGGIGGKCGGGGGICGGVAGKCGGGGGICGGGGGGEY